MKKKILVLVFIGVLFSVVYVFSSSDRSLNILSNRNKDKETLEPQKEDSVNIKYYNSPGVVRKKEKMIGLEESINPTKDDYNKTNIIYEDDNLTIYDVSHFTSDNALDSIGLYFIIEYKNMDYNISLENFVYELGEEKYYTTQLLSTDKGYIDDNMELINIRVTFSIDEPEKKIGNLYYYYDSKLYKLTDEKIENLFKAYNEEGSSWTLVSQSEHDGITEESWDVRGTGEN